MPECACHGGKIYYRLALADNGKSLYNYVYLCIAVLVVCTAIAVSVAKAPHVSQSSCYGWLITCTPIY